MARSTPLTWLILIYFAEYNHNLNSILFQRVKNKLKGKFVDTLRLAVKGGHGGNGFPKYGGVGGQGGCVYCVAKEDTTLTNVVTK